MPQSFKFLIFIMVCLNRIVEFRTEELMKKAVEKVNKHNLNGRPLKVKEVSNIVFKLLTRHTRNKTNLSIGLYFLFGNVANVSLILFPQDPDGVIAQRDLHRAQGGGGGGPPGGHGGMNMGMGMDRMNMERMNMDCMGPGPGGPPMVNIPPSLMNNSNIPNEIIHGLQAGKIGSTVFVANVSCGL